MSDADKFNASALEAGQITPAHVTALTRRFQAANELAADGKCGPKTRALLELLEDKVPGHEHPAELPILLIDAAGWLAGDGVIKIPSHPSWGYAKLNTPDGRPGAIVAHYTATNHGTARAMANNRARPLAPADREASWHVSVEGDGTIVQMAPFLRGCWHAGGPTAKAIPNLGPANRTAVGIELVGHGDVFPRAQVDAACRLWRALVERYAIPEARAMVGHSDLDPTRKRDPGPVWTSSHAGAVLGYAYRR